MADAVVTIATAGAGTALVAGMNLGMAAVKFGINEATP